MGIKKAVISFWNVKRSNCFHNESAIPFAKLIGFTFSLTDKFIIKQRKKTRNKTSNVVLHIEMDEKAGPAQNLHNHKYKMRNNRLWFWFISIGVSYSGL